MHSRGEFAAWDGTHDRLFDEWVDAGERPKPRLEDLSAAIASGQTEFAAAAEFACSAVKHRTADRGDSIELPPPFDALDSAAYRTHGSAFAIRWAEKTFGERDANVAEET